jgi:hypothetical protein
MKRHGTDVTSLVFGLFFIGVLAQVYAIAVLGVVLAGAAFVAWAWKTLEVDQLIHLIRPDNHASIRVAEKLGSTFTHRMDIDGRPVDVYASPRPTGT